MPMRRHRAQYHWLKTEERGHIIEFHELGLLLHTIATRVGHNVSTIQRCVIQWIQEDLRARLRGSVAHRLAYSPVDTLSMARNIQDQFPSGAGGPVSTQTLRNRFHEVQLRTRVPDTGSR
ncbi:hypothetical protein TNCV_1101371 [Trichonephila clavipes]|nr:hypothetical protein TNCV_1101371 [Trichonephila clavipes]